MPQHTPGPWTLKKAAVRSATGRVVARIPALNADDYYLGKRETPPIDSLALQLQRESNAALIAAAPETAAERDRLRQVNEVMLEALKAVESEITRLERISKQAFSIDEVHPAVGRVADATRAALAAVEGPGDTHS